MLCPVVYSEPYNQCLTLQIVLSALQHSFNFVIAVWAQKRSVTWIRTRD